MSSILKVNTIQDTDGNNIINESGNVITIGASGDTITVPTSLSMTENLTVNKTTGAELILSRNDTSIAVDDLIGGIQFKANDASSSPDPQICGIKAISTGATNTNPKLSFFAGESNYNANTPNMSIDSGGNITMSSDLTVDTNTLFVDSSENTVVIGGTDATSWNANADELVVAGASAGGMTFYNPTQTNIFFADGTTGDDVSRGRIQYVHSGDSLIFGTDATERSRIDSSGNFMVGKTATGIGSAGAEFKSDGRIFSVVSGNYAGLFNRLSSDGEIVQIRREGTTVGSLDTVGVSTSGRLVVKSTTFDGYLDRAGTTIAKWMSSSFTPGADNTFDLGRGAERWRDLYLSGGAYIGGTGSANKLDDYEEGTWTPIVNTANGFSTGATNYSGTSAPRYTKIGNRVFLQAQVQMANSSGNLALDDSITMTGLPFTPADIERNTVTEYRYNNNVGYMTSYLTGTGAIFSAVRFIKGTPLRNGGSININLNFTV